MWSANHRRLPLEVNEFDFKTSQLAIAVDEGELRPILEERWPRYSASVEYWRVENIGAAPPIAVLNRLVEHVDTLIEELARLRATFEAA